MTPVTKKFTGRVSIRGKLIVHHSEAGGDSPKMIELLLEPKTGTSGYRQGAINLQCDRAAAQPFTATWDGNPDCGVKIIATNRANNLDGATRIGAVRALDIQARNRGTNLSWVKTMEVNARNDSGKNVSELHCLHVRAENYGNVYTDVKGLDIEISDENTTQSQERMGLHIRSTDLSGMSAVNEVLKISHTSTNGFDKLFHFGADTGDTAAANTHAIDGHALAFIAKCKMNATDGYLPFFAAVPS